MADVDEDDYMGDLSAFVGEDEVQKMRQSSTSGAGKSKNRDPEHMKLPWQERRRLKQQEKLKHEEEVRAAGLAAPIPASNIGFKLLQKMGFSAAKPSSNATEACGPDLSQNSQFLADRKTTFGVDEPSIGIGRPSATHWRDPIEISVKADKKGLGMAAEEKKAEEERERVRLAQQQRLVETQDALRSQFKESKRGRWYLWKMRSNFQKARAALLHLEGSDEWLESRVVAQNPEAAVLLGQGDTSEQTPRSQSNLSEGRQGAGLSTLGGVPGMPGGMPRGTERIGKVRKKRRVDDCAGDDVDDERGDLVEVGRVGEKREGEELGSEGIKAKAKLVDFASEEVSGSLCALWRVL